MTLKILFPRIALPHIAFQKCYLRNFFLMHFPFSYAFIVPLLLYNLQNSLNTEFSLSFIISNVGIDFPYTKAFLSIYIYIQHTFSILWYTFICILYIYLCTVYRYMLYVYCIHHLIGMKAYVQYSIWQILWSTHFFWTKSNQFIFIKCFTLKANFMTFHC